MLHVLVKYLFESKKLSLPGIGIFELESQSAEVDFGAGAISAPGCKLIFAAAENEDFGSDLKDDLRQWISAYQNIPPQAVQRQFNNYVNTMKTNLQNGEAINWAGLGVLKNEDGVICFTAQQAVWMPLGSVAARKVIRKNTSHATLVGDKETTTAQMREQLASASVGNGYSKVLIWALVAATLAAAAWYFSQYGCNKNGL